MASYNDCKQTKALKKYIQQFHNKMWNPAKLKKTVHFSGILVIFFDWLIQQASLYGAFAHVHCKHLHWLLRLRWFLKMVTVN